MRAIDWLARTAMLVLAALATLALIGSLASVSNSAIGDVFPGAVPERVDPRESAPRLDVADGPIGSESGATMTIESPVAAAPPERHETARWLKALTYAVIALVAVGAAGVIALARIGTHLRRVAER